MTWKILALSSQTIRSPSGLFSEYANIPQLQPRTWKCSRITFVRLHSPVAWLLVLAQRLDLRQRSYESVTKGITSRNIDARVTDAQTPLSLLLSHKDPTS